MGSALWLLADQPLHISATHDTEQRIFARLGERMAQRLAEQGHLAEEGLGADRRQLKPLAAGCEAIDVHSPSLQ
jgi:hypothetical protein